VHISTQWEGVQKIVPKVEKRLWRHIWKRKSATETTSFRRLSLNSSDKYYTIKLKIMHVIHCSKVFYEQALSNV
jgi:hypothetical protein